MEVDPWWRYWKRCGIGKGGRIGGGGSFGKGGEVKLVEEVDLKRAVVVDLEKAMKRAVDLEEVVDLEATMGRLADLVVAAVRVEGLVVDLEEVLEVAWVEGEVLGGGVRGGKDGGFGGGASGGFGRGAGGGGKGGGTGGGEDTIKVRKLRVRLLRWPRKLIREDGMEEGREKPPKGKRTPFIGRPLRGRRLMTSLLKLIEAYAGCRHVDACVWEFPWRLNGSR
ncbi:hypothetical protein ACLOJK_026669 [Asimina triloba]